MLKYWLKQNYQLAKAHLDWARGAPKLHRRFLYTHGYSLNLDNPQTFSEKIQWRKLRDRNPIFPNLCNKYLVRQYIADRLGHERAERLLVPLLQYVKDPAEIDFSALPMQFVLKATHGSSMNLIVNDAAQLNQKAARKQMRKWLITHFGVRDHEWIYRKTPKGIIAEALVALPDQLVDVHMDYFDGKLYDFMLIERNDGNLFKTRFDAEAKLIDVRSPTAANNPDAMPPDQLKEMIEIGEVLSRGLDYVRVDFMCGPERFYLGELTLLTGSGLVRPDPPSFDQELGSFWTIQ